MKSTPIFEAINGQHFFCNSHTIYLQSVVISVYSSFYLYWQSPPFPHWIQHVCNPVPCLLMQPHCLLFALCAPYHSCIKLLLMRTGHFLLLLRDIKSVQLVKHVVALIVKQPPEMHDTYMSLWLALISSFIKNVSPGQLSLSAFLIWQEGNVTGRSSHSELQATGYTAPSPQQSNQHYCWNKLCWLLYSNVNWFSCTVNRYISCSLYFWQSSC